MPAAPCQLEPHPPPPQDDDDPPQDEEDPQDDDPLEHALDDELPPLAHQLPLALELLSVEKPLLNERTATVTTNATTRSPITMKTNTMPAPSLTPRSSRGAGSPRPA
ncbi:hypothetical protein [Streptomyces sp. NPDC048269]|uniref:hypothetical protein n=1 Tax=Streptomyces sp. NPDC048269 TaxID=3155753 RepID=UPI003427ECE9